MKNDGLTHAHHQGGPGDHPRRPLKPFWTRSCSPASPRPGPRSAEYAPKMLTMKIDPDKIREVIGSGGKVIQKISAESGAKIDIEDDGTIYICRGQRRLLRRAPRR